MFSSNQKTNLQTFIDINMTNILITLVFSSIKCIWKFIKHIIYKYLDECTINVNYIYEITTHYFANY